MFNNVFDFPTEPHQQQVRRGPFRAVNYPPKNILCKQICWKILVRQRGKVQMIILISVNNYKARNLMSLTPLFWFISNQLGSAIAHL